MRTAIVVTIRNEASRLPEFLSSLERQTRLPDIVVITDGGSTDETQSVLADFASRTSLPFRWVIVPGNRSRGRNAAVRLAEADLIAVTDVCVVTPTWFERIIEPLERNEADLVAGWYELLASTPRERCIGLLTQYSLHQVEPATFLPSSRSVAFSRRGWEEAGGYPEDFSGNEDTVFDLAMERLRPRKVFVRDAVVRWRPAASVKQVFRQYQKYAEGDGQASIFLWSQTRYGLVYLTYALGALLTILGALWPILWLALAGGIIAYLLFRTRKVWRARLWSQTPYALAVALALDFALMIGWATGRLGAGRSRSRRGR